MDFQVKNQSGELSFSVIPNRPEDKPGEVNYRKLSRDDQKRFDESDAAEWKSVLSSKAVVVLDPSAAAIIRARSPDRILSSRMVRRMKPQPGLSTPPKCKSRWCIHGHQDPDTLSLRVYAPTPHTESLYAFLHIAACGNLSLEFADVKNAFCQSPKEFWNRSGSIFVAML